MTKPRALIVDDEPLARERLGRLLQRQDAVELAGECGGGPEAIAAIQQARPEIVFLDVQLPGCSGLEVVKGLPASVSPAIVFVTAHDRFAVDAFSASAVDYLLKPFDEARFREALARALDRLASRRACELDEQVGALLSRAARREPRCLAVRTDGRVRFVSLHDIVWIEAANNHSLLHLADTSRLMLRETLAALELRLGTAGFVRVHRSAVVRIDQIREFESTSGNDHLVVLRNGTRLPLSRQLRQVLEAALTGTP